jgi:DNA-directed RNA polymerase subunit M/transcription elongation factor TFIIS
MANLDLAQEWRQLRETYNLMAEDELAAVAADAYELTSLAKEVLQSVIQERGLRIQVITEAPPPPSPDHSDSDLDSQGWVASMEEAKKLKQVLNEGGVPCFFGQDNVMELEDFKGSFDRGIEVKTRAADRDRARFARMRAAAEEDPNWDAPDPEDEKKYAVLCPKCRSEEVVFEGSQPGKTDLPADSIFNWSCDACGYEWTDDGVAKPL